MRVNVYIDGFNFYYAAVKNTPYKWLYYSKLCSLLLPNDTVNQIKYFTANISPRPGHTRIMNSQSLSRMIQTCSNPSEWSRMS